jgi:hypothetical protein
MENFEDLDIKMDADMYVHVYSWPKSLYLNKHGKKTTYVHGNEREHEYQQEHEDIYE